MSSSIRDNLAGAVLMSASMAAFTINDAFMKVLSEDWPFFQAVFLRTMLAALFIGAMAWQRGFRWGAFLGSDWKLVIIRTFSEIGAVYFFLTALFHMPIANVTAIIQALPLTVTLAGALFLKESIGWRRMGAILLGGVGMLLIVRPGSDSFDIYTVYGILAVACVTVRDIAARQFSGGVPTMTVAFLTALSIGVFSGFGAAITEWEPITAPTFGLVLGAGLTVIGGYVFSIQVMRQGDIAFIAPFRYTALIWALVLGWVVFGEWPDSLTMIGAAIIVGTGLFSFWRQQLAQGSKA